MEVRVVFWLSWVISLVLCDDANQRAKDIVSQMTLGKRNLTTTFLKIFKFYLVQQCQMRKYPWYGERANGLTILEMCQQLTD